MYAVKMLVAVGLFLLSTSGCSRPPMRIVVEEQVITIDLQAFGEYPSDVAGLRVLDTRKNEVVWELKGRDDPQLGRIKLQIGDNPALPTDIRHGTYQVIVPGNEQTFALAPRTKYVVEVWKSDASPSSTRIAEFVTPN